MLLLIERRPGRQQFSAVGNKPNPQPLLSCGVFLSCWASVMFIYCIKNEYWYFFTGDRLSGKPGNVREFDSCQGNVRDFTKNLGNVREKILSGKSCLKLFVVSCIFVSVQVFSRNLFSAKY